MDLFIKMKMIWILLFGIIGMVLLVNIAKAQDNMSVSAITGATSSISGDTQSAGAFNVSKAFDGSLGTEYNNVATGIMSLGIVFDCSKINCYINNLTIIAKSFGGDETMKLEYQNATTGVWSVGWKTLNIQTNYDTFYFNNSGIGASGFNLSRQTSGNLGIREFTVINGTNSSFDDIPPMFNLTLNQSSIQTGDIVNATSNVTDNMNLSSCQFIINQSGIKNYYNFSVNSTQDKCSQNFSISASAGTTLNFSLIVNDSSNNKAQSNIIKTIGDLTFPVLFGQSISTTSPITTDLVNLSINTTDNSGFIQYCRVELNISANTFSNITLTSLGNNVFADARTYALGVHNITNFYCADGSNNIARDLSNFTFIVSNPPPSSSGGGSGGGGSTTIEITQLVNGTPYLTFGIATLYFTVTITPSEANKQVLFKNIGNLSFTKGEVNILGDANKYLNASICNIDLSICKTKDITIGAGENAFLVVNGSFIQELGNGAEGIIRLNGNQVFDLPVVIDRLPFYKFFMKPFINYGFSDLSAILLGYSTLSILTIGVVFFLRMLVGM